MADKAQKPTFAEREQRLKIVHKMLLDGKSRPDIMEYCSKNYNLKRAATDNLIQECTHEIEQDFKAVKGGRIAGLFNKLSDVYGRSLEMDNLAVARQVIMDEAKLLGADNHAKTHIIDDKRELSETNDDDLETLAGVSEEG